MASESNNEQSNEYTAESIKEMKVIDLKDALKKFGLKTNGKKAELQKRLREHCGIASPMKATRGRKRKLDEEDQHTEDEPVSKKLKTNEEEQPATSEENAPSIEQENTNAPEKTEQIVTEEK